MGLFRVIQERGLGWRGITFPKPFVILGNTGFGNPWHLGSLWC